MSDAQRVEMMARRWPKAAKAQGWLVGDRARRLVEISKAVGREVESASELNSTSDVDKVFAHFGFLAGSLKATIETDNPDLGRARVLRFNICEGLKCLALYHPNVDHWLAEVIKDKFKHGSRAMPLTLDDLHARPYTATNKRTGQTWIVEGQLGQVLQTLARAIQAKRKEQGDSLHTMKTRAGVKCDCRQCVQPARRVFVMPDRTPEDDNNPF